MVGILLAQEMLDLEAKVAGYEEDAKRTGLIEAWAWGVSELSRAQAIRRAYRLPELEEIRASMASGHWERCPSCGYEPMRGRDGYHSCKERITAMLTITDLRKGLR